MRRLWEVQKKKKASPFAIHHSRVGKTDRRNERERKSTRTKPPDGVFFFSFFFFASAGNNDNDKSANAFAPVTQSGC